MGKAIDLTGHSFGRLTVIQVDETKPRGHGYGLMWICKCKCGNLTSVQSRHLRSGKIVSCGCYHSEELSNRQTTHKQSHTPLYHVWSAMKMRCSSPKSTEYHRYGGRGIKVCDRWKTFINFYKDMSPSYKHGLTLDRINNDGDYTPDNCRWVTSQENSRNTSRNVLITINGETKYATDWATEFANRHHDLYHMLKKGKHIGYDIIIQGGKYGNA